MKKYLFLDRDGTLVEEPSDFQVDSLQKVKFKKDVFVSLNKLKALGYSFIMVSNQDGLGTASFSESSFNLVQDFIIQSFKSQGIEFDDVLLCPHFESEGCECRKPRLGLLTSILASSQWSREESYVIGDRQSDMTLAKNMNISGLRVDQKSWISIYETIKNKSRRAAVKRITSETDIDVIVDLDSSDTSVINTGRRFLDHMLEQVARHGRMFISLQCKGDYDIDDHHSIEDIAISLGEAIRTALGTKHRVERYGFMLPMDESLATVALDFSGRPFFKFNASFTSEKVGDVSSQMLEHFFQSIAFSLKASLHMKVEGRNDHHKAEALFKAFGKCMAQACSLTNSELLPSTKGVL